MIRNYFRIAKYFVLMIFAFILLNAQKIAAQVRIPFTQRTSQYSPTKKIYNVKGDFTLMGNTNMTLQNYDDNQPNNNNFMRYVDVDNDSNTWNSSSSTLQFSTENGANPDCSKIVYAGLYWTGRAAIDNASSSDVFEVSKTENVVNQAINNNLTIGHQQSIANTNYSLLISRNNNSSLKNPIYTFSGNSNNYVFEFTNNIGANAVTVSTNGGSLINIPVVIATIGNNLVATFINPFIIVDGTVNITINSLTRDSSTSLGTSQTENSSFANANIAGIFTGALIISRNYDKRIISLKGPNSNTYTQFTANSSDINYPNTNDAYIYTGYHEITDYVRTNGIGVYFAADIALKEGNGGGSGYYGGWGMIVVYENQLMKRRDVTIFDGYAFVTGTGDFDLPISGFNTVQSGPVGIKLGLMAGEGDRPFTGDYFKIQKQIDQSYIALTHSGNSADNFFNSSIVTGGNPRNPNILNNTSIDLSMFNIPNVNNEVITNNQTSVNFKYGSTFETFVIYTIALSVDAYIPDIDVLMVAQAINGTPVLGNTITTQPNDIVDLKIEIRNSGNEPVNNSKFVVAIPYTANYVAGSLSKNLYFTPLPSPNNCYFDPSLGANGSIVWDFGTLPLPANPSVLLADYTFKIKITDDCSILKNTACGQNASISGLTSGIGAITGISFADKSYFIGYNNANNCIGLPMLDPLPLPINATAFVQQNCQNTPDVRVFTYCNIPNNTIPITDVLSSFPTGTLFYNQFPVTSTTIQYTITNPFPGTVGTTSYYAVPPSNNASCNYQFIINITNIPIAPVVTNIVYCQGSTASPLTATLSNPANILFYYSSLTSGAQLSIVPSTVIAGQFTYYVAEAASATCISEKVAIVVTINPTPVATVSVLSIIQGCSTNAITNLAYSETLVTITLAQFVAYGGTYTNFTSNPIITYIDSKTGICPIVVTRIINISGSCINENFIEIIEIKDFAAPTVNTLTNINVSGCNAAFPNPDVSIISANDNCSVPTVLFVSDSAPNIVDCTETIIRKYSVTDACGNAIFVNQNLIRNIDIINPTAINPNDINVLGCNASFPNPDVAVISANDNCSIPTVLFVSDSAPNIVGCTETIIRKYSVTDACGNAIFVNQNLIRTIDLTNPTAFNPGNIDVSGCNTSFPNPDASIISANDNCSIPTVLFISDSAPNIVGCIETIIRKYSVTDACGNAIFVNQNLIRNIDIINPTAINPSNINVSGCNASFPNPDVSIISANDNCSVPTVLFVSDSAPNIVDCTETIIRKYSVTDACGNAIFVNQNLIRNIDIINPTAINPSNINVSGCNASFPNPDVAVISANDNCSIPTVLFVSDSAPNIVGCTETIIRKYLVTDACGNAIFVNQNLIRNIDTINPTAINPSNINVSSCNVSFPIPDVAVISANDNCSVPTVLFVSDSAPNVVGCTETIIRKYSVTDACGNAIFVNQNLIRNIDTIAPQLASSFNSNINVNCNEIPVKPNLNFTDNCTATINIIYNENISTPVNGQYIVTRSWIASDNCSNSTTVTQNINVTIQDSFTSINKELCNLDTDKINLNTFLPASLIGLGNWIDSNNSGGILPNNQFSALGINVGIYSLLYQINDPICPRNFEIKMKIATDCKVLGVSECVIKVMNAVSPNNDGRNDTFFIENLDCYPDNSVEIFNRWGVLVFEGYHYDNNNIVFNGISNGRTVVAKDELLPAGTYFYILKYIENNGAAIDKSGYLYLNK